jgi:hypothetical protein
MEQQPVPAAATISLGNLITNAFSSPADAFEGLRTSPPRASTWVLPLVLLIVFASLMSYVMFTNETLRTQFMDSKSQRLQQRVQSGQMTQEQADRALQQTEQMGGMMVAFGIIGSVITISIFFFGAALIFWLVGKLALKAPAGYGKYLELWGTSEWIGLLGAIITLLMILGMGSMYASPSAALAVLSSFNPSDTTHRLLGSLNIFSIWQAIVLGIGLSKYAEKPLGTGIGIALGLWVIWVLLTTFALSAFIA